MKNPTPHMGFSPSTPGIISEKRTGHSWSSMPTIVDTPNLEKPFARD